MNVFSWPSGSLSATAVVTVALLRASASSIAVDGGEDESPAEPFRWDSNKVARAKVILAFEEHERQAPRYRTAITNWNPGFVECDGITNFVFLGESGGAEGWTRRYRGGNRDRWVDVALNVFKSSREAHEYMVKLKSDLPRGQPGDNEVTDPKQRIGFRCFRGAFRDVMEQILFIRNNYCVAIFGKSVKVETLARDLDRQLVELSEEMPKGSP
jgi:hypothetical protein